MSERAVVFTNQGERLFGIVHEPEEPNGIGVIMLTGWSGTRGGPHNIFVSFARELTALDFTCLRFDFRGRGDSEGTLETTTLITMIDDLRTAAGWLVGEAKVQHVAVTGICSGAEVALGGAMVHPAIDSLLLWSAPVFWAEQNVQREVKKKAHYLREYAGKLFSPATWAKLFGGTLQPKMILKVLFGRRSKAVSGGERPVDFREATIKRFAGFKGQVLSLYGTNDPVTAEASPWYEELCRQGSIPRDVHVVEGANHSYYSLVWKREVLDVSTEWLRRRYHVQIDPLCEPRLADKRGGNQPAEPADRA